MAEMTKLEPLIAEMLTELLEKYEAAVPATGVFKDVRVWRQVQFDDPTTALPGKLEFVIMHMDARLDPKYDVLRFMSVRVMKSRAGGISSSTCLHGPKDELRAQLIELRDEPDFVIDRVRELADGLPEETNPDAWR